MGLTLDGHLLFAHRFQKRALGLGSGPVDFVYKDYVVENGSRLKLEDIEVSIEDGNTCDVGWQEVARALNPTELQPEDFGYGNCHRRFSQSGQIFDEQVAPGEKAGQGELQCPFFSMKVIGKERDGTLNALVFQVHRIQLISMER
jgi:hypothetical protein